METPSYPNCSALLLAAGFGTRLRPFTDHWPKCLMPIDGKALLEIWLDGLLRLQVPNVLVNMHAHYQVVEKFLQRKIYRSWVKGCLEEDLLGTAGTVRQNYSSYAHRTLFLAHADNLCLCDLAAFFRYHFYERPKDTLMTMMTFETPTPESCGIVELDTLGRVQRFHEKSSHPPGRLANAAIYLIEPEIVHWIQQNPSVTDFSNEVIPRYMGRIATWQNKGVMRDIGTPHSLQEAQKEGRANGLELADMDDWQKEFARSSIQALIQQELR